MQCVQETARELTTRLDDLSAAISAELEEALPAWRGIDGLRESCASNMQLKLKLLQSETPMDIREMPSEGLSFATDLARHGDNLAALRRAYHLGHQFFWRTWTTALRDRVEDPMQLAELYDEGAQFLFQYFDTVTSSVIEEYHHERTRWAGSVAALRSEAAQQLLGDGPVDVPALQADLSYDIGQQHLAMVVAGRGLLSDAALLQNTKTAIAAFARRVGPLQVTVVAARRDAVWAWLGAHEPVTQELVAEAATTQFPDGVRVGVGRFAGGLAGFRTSHAEALEAVRMAELARRRSPTPVCYHDVCLSSLLLADTERARRFVQEELRDLAADDDATRRLRATLKVFLDEGGNQARTARRLGIHYNTVGYRVRRAEELLGHPLKDRRFDIEAALRLDGILGIEWLHDNGSSTDRWSEG